MARASRLLLAATVYLGVAVAAAPSSAVVLLDMEGFATPGSFSSANGTKVMNGFNVNVTSGYYVDSAHGFASQPKNGSDWLMHDHTGLLTITKVGGGTFSASSFDATFSVTTYTNNPSTNNNIVAVGTLFGGGTISQTFTVDEDLPFQTFSFDASWANLIGLTFQNPDIPGQSGGRMAYDNIVVDVAAVPLPAALPLFATVLAGGGLLAWRRKRKIATSAIS